MTSGKIAQIVGPVIDVEFSSESGLPKIYDSLEIEKSDGTKLVLEGSGTCFTSLFDCMYFLDWIYC